jgi:hypothetical protein
MVIPLKSITIASPCQAEWENMKGNNQIRFCEECKLNVYNLSGMTTQAAEQLIRETEGRLCVRYFQRADGTVINQDCPIGLNYLHTKKNIRLSRIAVAITLVTIMGVFTVNAEANKIASPQAIQTEKQNKAPQSVLMGKPAQHPAIMGDIAAPPKQPALMGEMALPPKPPSKTHSSHTKKLKKSTKNPIQH